MKAQKASGSKKSSQLAKAMAAAKKFAKSAIKGSTSQASHGAHATKDAKKGHAQPQKGDKPLHKQAAHKGQSAHPAHGGKGGKPAPKAQVAGRSADKGGMSHNGQNNKGKHTAPAPQKTHSKDETPKHAAPAHGKKVAAPAPVAKGKGGSVASSMVSRKTVEVEAVCREVACEGLSTTGGYCRLHYIKNWKKIKRKELILKEGKLNQYIEELVAKYPDKYIEAIRQDLAGDKEFAKVIYDLDLDESVDDFDVEGDSADGLIDSIKRDFDDEGEGF